MSENDHITTGQARRSKFIELVDRRCRCRIRKLTTEDESFGQDSDLLWRHYLKKPFFVFDAGLEKDEFVARLRRFNSENQLVLVEKPNEVTGELQIIGIAMVCPVSDDIQAHVIYFDNASARDMLCAMIIFLKTARKNYRFKNSYHYTHEWTKNIHDRCCEYGLLEYVKTIPEQDHREREYLYKSIV